MDKRIKRTKGFVYEALMELMNEKAISEITVKGLCERADINRSTFYLHFSGIEEIVDSFERQLADSFDEIFEAHKISEGELKTSFYEFFYDLTCYIKKEHKLMRALFGNNRIMQLPTISKALQTGFGENILAHYIKDKTKFDYAYLFLIDGCVIIYKVWIRNNMAEKEEDIAGVLNEFFCKFLLAPTGS